MPKQRPIRAFFAEDALGSSAYKIARFWRHIDKTLGIDCWIWIGARQSRGYGIVGIAPRKTVDPQLALFGKLTLLLAHRVAWVLSHGREIPRGKEIKQKCGVTACCNPAHLKCVRRRVDRLHLFRKERPRTGFCKAGHSITTGIACRQCNRLKVDAWKEAHPGAALEISRRYEEQYFRRSPSARREPRDGNFFSKGAAG